MRILLSLISILAMCIIGVCSSSQTKSTSTSTSSSTERSVNIDVGSALRDITYSPGGRGFPYKSTYVDPVDFKAWVSQFSPEMSQAIGALPAGYAIQVTGHTCSIGPREADATHRGNV